MTIVSRSEAPLLRRKSLTACVAALFSANAIAAFAGSGEFPFPRYDDGSPRPTGAIHTVTNCDDAGQGSLRDAVASAASGDAIDLTALACSDITLFNGRIPMTTSNLMLLGPGVGPAASHHLTIHGYYDRVFANGSGTLVISGLEVADGHFQGAFARGGCILSQGDLVIIDSIVTGCEVDAPFGANTFAAGGAIAEYGELWMRNSVVKSSTAYSATDAAYGGGIFAAGIVTIDASTIAGNRVLSPQAYAIGGGLEIVGSGDVEISSSTISGNQAELAGGIRIDTLGTSEILDSTLSGNYALYVGAASFSNTPLKLINSTVARNSAYSYSAGIYSDQPVMVQSSMMADNRSVAPGNADICAPAVVGFGNLITSSCNATPADTIAVCPRLTALADHGGPTWTLGLVPGSPGIDAGFNTIPLLADQRGAQYPRVSGTGPDIGAYEWQGELGDALFKSAFEVTCDEY
jgi:hypothetical protein